MPAPMTTTFARVGNSAHVRLFRWIIGCCRICNAVAVSATLRRWYTTGASGERASSGRSPGGRRGPTAGVSAADWRRRSAVDRSTGWRLARSLEEVGWLHHDPVTHRYRLGLPPVRARDPRPRHHRCPRRSPSSHDRARRLDRRKRRLRDPRWGQRRLHRQDRWHPGGPGFHPGRPARPTARDRGRQGVPCRHGTGGARRLPRRSTARLHADDRHRRHRPSDRRG